MRRSLGSTVDPVVFGVSVGISVLFVLWGVFFTESLSAVGSAVMGFLIDDFGWVFFLSTFGFLLFVGYLAFSLFKDLRTEPLTTLEPRGAPEPGRAAGRPTGAPAPQKFRAERDPGER